MDAKHIARAHLHDRRRVLLRRLILSASMIILALLAGEIAIRVFVPVRSVGPVATTYDPIYGKRLKRSYWCRRIGPEMSYVLTTNSLGFRGPEPTGPITGSVIFLGDSFTMGSAVNDGEEFPALIRARLDERFGREVVPVVNAGIANTGNGRWVKFLRDEAPRYEPRFIVMQFFVNDFADNVNERLFRLDADGTLVENPVPQISRSQRLQQIVEGMPLLRYSYLVAVARQAVSNVINRQAVMWNDTDPVTVDPLTYRIFDEALRVCVSERGWPVGVVIIALRPDQESKIRAVADRYGVQVLRLPSKGERPDLYWAVDPHWHAAGNVWAADAIYDAFLADLPAEEPEQIAPE